MTLLTLLLSLFRVGTPTSGVYTETCVATVFAYPGDRWAGGATPYLMRRVRPDDVGVAHRTLPFGTRIRITNPRTQLSTEATVIDRGPFGRRTRRGKWYNGIMFYRRYLRRRLPIPNFGWTACLDLTPIVQRRLKHNGMERVRFRVVKWPRRYRQRLRPRPRIVRTHVLFGSGLRGQFQGAQVVPHGRAAQGVRRRRARGSLGRRSRCLGRVLARGGAEPEKGRAPGPQRRGRSDHGGRVASAGSVTS